MGSDSRLVRGGRVKVARKTKAEAEQTRCSILDAAEQLFYEQGVARTTLEEIAQTAGVTRGAIYWHFRDKDDLFEAMQARAALPQEDVFDALASDEGGDPLLGLREACKEAIRQTAADERRRRVYTILLLRCEYVGEMKATEERRRRNAERMIGRLESIFAKAARNGTLSVVWSPKLAALTLHGLLVGLFVNWLEDPSKSDFATLGPDCVDALFASLREPEETRASKRSSSPT
ncbi:MAG: TetR family transcriptional regulator [Alphaproteobacteria bacterium]|nr:MAG: TetR family transcriptional regulator [Alphaproteobacteria bacterium]